jgi:hypothetical protein
MMPLGPATRIHLAAGATVLRQSFDGLSDLVRHQFANQNFSLREKASPCKDFPTQARPLLPPPNFPLR